MQDTTLSQDFSSYAPLDYDVTISEDIQVGEIVTAISLSDDFSVGSYNLVLESGKLLLLCCGLRNSFYHITLVSNVI